MCSADSTLGSLSIVVPAYNEALRLQPSLDKIRQFLDSCTLSFSEVLVVNDGSSDQTAALVRNTARLDPRIALLENPHNCGKGYSVRNGVLHAKGEWILVTDADLSSPIEELSVLHRAAVESDAAIAIGSRALDRSLIGVHQPLLREACGRFFNVCMRVAMGLPFRDTQCGFKLFQAAAAKDVFSQQRLYGFSYDVENLYLARLLEIRTVEVPVRWNNVDGTKVGGFSGLQAFADLVRIRSLHSKREVRERLQPSVSSAVES